MYISTPKCIFPLLPPKEMYISTNEMYISGHGNVYFHQWKRIFPPLFAESIDTQGIEGSFLRL